MIAVEEMIKQLSTLIKECEKLRPFPSPYSSLDFSDSTVSQKEQKEEKKEELESLRYRLQAAIHRCTTPDDSYRKNLNSRDKDSVESLLRIAQALYADLQAGWFRSVSELIHADMFSDLLEVAREFHRHGHKDAAAVQAGTALELHLRLLAEKHDIETVTEKNQSKGAGNLNEELKKAGVYGKIEQQYVAAMLAIRNAAAHGDYDEYSADQVGELISRVREFVKRFPA